jgi:hypothetical protein
MPGQRHLGRSITADQLSDQLDNLVSPHTLRKWARQGRIPGSFKLGHAVYFPRNAAAWLVRDQSMYGGAGLPIGAISKEEGTRINGTGHPT